MDEPKIRERCTGMYNEMFLHSYIRESDDLRIWSGRITEIADRLNIPRGTYVVIVNKLQFLGCITRLVEGRVNRPSLYALHHSPESVEWISGGRRRERKKVPDEGLTATMDDAMLRQAVGDILRQLAPLQGLNIVEVLKTHNDQIVLLQDDVKRLQERTVAQ